MLIVGLFWEVHQMCNKKYYYKHRKYVYINREIYIRELRVNENY